MKKKDIFTQAKEAGRQDVYYITDRNGNGIYAQKINVEAIFSIPEEQLEQLRVKHEALQKELEKKPLDQKSHSESLDLLNNFTTLQLINEGLNRHYFRRKPRAFYEVTDHS